MIQIGNFKFEDSEVSRLPKDGDNKKIGEEESFLANATGENGNVIPVVLTYTPVLRVGVETQDEIDQAIVNIDQQVLELTEKKSKKESNKDKFK